LHAIRNLSMSAINQRDRRPQRRYLGRLPSGCFPSRSQPVGFRVGLTGDDIGTATSGWVWNRRHSVQLDWKGDARAGIMPAWNI